jgi:DNA repair protein RecN (Recombination protein N)
MLQKLYIENYALIDHLEIQFGSGLTTITGETGAGKSILLGALGVLLGARADTATLRCKERSCVIEGEFKTANTQIKQILSQCDIEFSSPMIVRRSVAPSGKQRSFVNDVPVSLAVLKNIGELLIDVHSQHQNLLLQNAAFQLKVVDSLANNKAILEEYRTIYAQTKQARTTMENLEQQSRLSKSDIDYYTHLFAELSDARLQNGEQEQLEQEEQQLSHAGEIQAAFAAAAALLGGEEACAATILRDAENTIEKAGSVYEKALPIASRLQSVLIEVRDIASEVERIAATTDVNPERLSEVEQRLDTIYTLQKKHKVTSIAELITMQEEFQQKINLVDNLDERLAAARKEYERLQGHAQLLAQKITDSRSGVFANICSHVTTILSDLGIPNAAFKVSHEICANLTPTGQDAIDFLFSANKGVDVQNIVKVASGGEIARLMLALKSLVAWTGDLPTIIFDEIDTGVSGGVADKMGQIIEELGKKIQVINITHLPQIAAKGVEHFMVYKEETSSATITQIKKLTHEQRITQIAKMLSGQSISDAAIRNARELLQK